METEGRHERGTDEGERDTEVVVYGAGGAEVRRVGVEDSPAPIELAEGERAAVVWAGTHELALMGSGERVDARDEVVMAARRRHGFEGRNEALEHAILTDADDPLAAASGTMRDPSEAPAVVRAAEQDASLGNLTIPAAPGEFDPPGAKEEAEARARAYLLRHEVELGGDPWSGDPGDEHDPHHVETGRLVVIRDGEGEIVRLLPVDATVELSGLAPGETVGVEEWPEAALPGGFEAAAPDVRPTVYAPYGSLTDDALERLEELGLQVEEIGPDDDPFGKGPDVHTDQEWDELAVADTAADGTVRELRLLEGGAVDLTPRKVQVWIDLRFQYLSDHPYGSADELEEQRLRTIGGFVEQFAKMTVTNRFEGIEGMQIQSVVGHILDKPGDPFPAAG